MILVDSCGWIEYFGEGPLADQYAAFIEKTDKDDMVTPTIVLYEVYKKIKCTRGEEKALEAYAQISLTRIIELTSSLSVKAADVSIKNGIAMADSIVVATANYYGAQILTSDHHFKMINGVKFISKWIEVFSVVPNLAYIQLIPIWCNSDFSKPDLLFLFIEKEQFLQIKGFLVELGMGFWVEVRFPTPLRLQDPELRPEFFKSLKTSKTEKTVKVKNFDSRYSKWLLYSLEVVEKVDRIFKKLRKKDLLQFEAISKKVSEILENAKTSYVYG